MQVQARGLLSCLAKQTTPGPLSWDSGPGLSGFSCMACLVDGVEELPWAEPQPSLVTPWCVFLVSSEMVGKCLLTNFSMGKTGQKTILLS